MLLKKKKKTETDTLVMQLLMQKIFTLQILTKCVTLNVLYELNPLESQETICKCKFKFGYKREHESHPLH